MNLVPSAVVWRNKITNKYSEVELQILRSATNLIDQGTNWTWSLSEIADDAQVASNFIFRKFGSRENFVKSLCKSWKSELELSIEAFVGPERMMENLRWLVTHRKRIAFLVAERVNEIGQPGISQNLMEFLPPVDEAVAELKVLFSKMPESSITEAALHANVQSAIQAGLGIILFESSPTDFSDEENDELLFKIWQKMWQITTGQDHETTPDYFNNK